MLIVAKSTTLKVEVLFLNNTKANTIPKIKTTPKSKSKFLLKLEVNSITKATL